MGKTLRRNTDSWALLPEAKTCGICIFTRLFQDPWFHPSIVA